MQQPYSSSLSEVSAVVFVFEPPWKFHNCQSKPKAKYCSLCQEQSKQEIGHLGDLRWMPLPLGGGGVASQWTFCCGVAPKAGITSQLGVLFSLSNTCHSRVQWQQTATLRRVRECNSWLPVELLTRNLVFFFNAFYFFVYFWRKLHMNTAVTNSAIVPLFLSRKGTFCTSPSFRFCSALGEGGGEGEGLQNPALQSNGWAGCPALHGAAKWVPITSFQIPLSLHNEHFALITAYTKTRTARHRQRMLLAKSFYG